MKTLKITKLSLLIILATFSSITVANHHNEKEANMTNITQKTNAWRYSNNLFSRRMLLGNWKPIWRKYMGVKEATSGYANGKTKMTYYQIIGSTDHAETVQVTYDANKISLEKLLLNIIFKSSIQPALINKEMIAEDNIEREFIIKITEIKRLF